MNQPDIRISLSGLKVPEKSIWSTNPVTIDRGLPGNPFCLGFRTCLNTGGIEEVLNSVENYQVCRYLSEQQRGPYPPGVSQS